MDLGEVATSCFGGMAIPCWQDCYPVLIIGVNPWITILIRIVFQKMLIYFHLVKGWDALPIFSNRLS